MEKSQTRKLKAAWLYEKALLKGNQGMKPAKRAKWGLGRDLASSRQITKLVPCCMCVQGTVLSQEPGTLWQPLTSVRKGSM